jgi:hypothetical protein
MQIAELRPLDTFCTYKPVKFSLKPIWAPLEYLADKGIRRYGQALYSGEVKANHIRVCVGKFNNMMIGFEWTFPTARFFEVKGWMLDPAYAKIYRSKAIWNANQDANNALIIKKYLNKFENDKYDWLQLVGIALRWEGMQLPGSKEVCSTGVRKLMEYMLGVSLFSEVPVWRTPPCSWLNHPEILTLLNDSSHKKVNLLPEQELTPFSFKG